MTDTCTPELLNALRGWEVRDEDHERTSCCVQRGAGDTCETLIEHVTYDQATAIECQIWGLGHALAAITGERFD